MQRITESASNYDNLEQLSTLELLQNINREDATVALAVEKEIARLKSTWVNPRMLASEIAIATLGKEIEREYLLSDLLKRPNVSYDVLMKMQYEEGVQIGTGLEPGEYADQVEVQVKYEGYIARQQDEVNKHLSLEEQLIPQEMDFDGVTSLSFEVRQKFKSHKPETVGQASRISGVTPAAISLLLIHLKRHYYNKNQKEQEST